MGRIGKLDPIQSRGLTSPSLGATVQTGPWDQPVSGTRVFSPTPAVGVDTWGHLVSLLPLLPFVRARPCHCRAGPCGQVHDMTLMRGTTWSVLSSPHGYPPAEIAAALLACRARGSRHQTRSWRCAGWIKRADCFFRDIYAPVGRTEDLTRSGQNTITDVLAEEGCSGRRRLVLARACGSCCGSGTSRARLGSISSLDLARDVMVWREFFTGVGWRRGVLSLRGPVRAPSQLPVRHHALVCYFLCIMMQVVAVLLGRWVMEPCSRRRGCLSAARSYGIGVRRRKAALRPWILRWFVGIR